MIMIPQPAMAMNADDVPPPWYQMTNTWKVKSDVTPQHLLGWAAVVLKDFKTKTPDKPATLIMNCHGYSSKGVGGYGLSMGTGISDSDVVHFEKIAPFVDQIYIVACKAAQHVVGKANGDRFIASIAKAAGAKVVASSASQSGGPGEKGNMPFGYIDDFEGDVFYYDREGSITGFILGKG